jgi:hypothetical protein
MRRGLIARSPDELSDAVLEMRLDRVRAAMGAAGFDALLIYTNITRAAGVSWLTGFVPYWSEALLVVPREGAPGLVAALSFRVKSWIERVSRLGEVFHTPRIGLKAAELIAAVKSDAVVGIVDFDGLPEGIAEDLRAGGAALKLRDASAEFAGVRAKADAAEVSLAEKAAAIAQRSLAAVRAPGGNFGPMHADVEGEARLLGAEEIYIAVAADLAREVRFLRVEGAAAPGENFAIRATVAYKGTWVRLVRAFCPASIERDAASQLAQAAASLPDHRGFSRFGSWSVEGCRMAQPLAPLMGTRLGITIPPQPGALVSVQGTLAIDGLTVPVGVPALLGEPGESARLLVDPVFS